MNKYINWKNCYLTFPLTTVISSFMHLKKYSHKTGSCGSVTVLPVAFSFLPVKWPQSHMFIVKKIFVSQGLLSKVYKPQVNSTKEKKKQNEFQNTNLLSFLFIFHGGQGKPVWYFEIWKTDKNLGRSVISVSNSQQLTRVYQTFSSGSQGLA